MVEIIFYNKEDARQLFNYIKMQIRSRTVHSIDHNIFLFEDELVSKVKINSNVDEIVSICKSSFLQFFVKIKLHDWFRILIKEHYYYENDDEQQHILEIVHSMLEGKRIELTTFVQDASIIGQIERAIDNIFHEQLTFLYESFVRFRMRPFFEKLESYVEIAIDEYKMEQEYQIFIETLRRFLIDRTPKMNQLHLLLDDGISFFDEYFVEIKRAELVKMIDRKLLSNHPVYIDSVTIAPLLSIAPSTIYLYTDNCEQSLVRTIYNIFEERVKINPVSLFRQLGVIFPYTANEKN